MKTRAYTKTDRFFINFDKALRTLLTKPPVTERAYPAKDIIAESELSDAESKHHARLMRINHTGEVCAQALYQGQALTAKLPEVREQMERSAAEENDHLSWCQVRIDELENRTSFLNPLWFTSSYFIGASAGLAGDKWSLGFVAETERQVEKHLQSHLDEIPLKDTRTRVILEKMKEDEIRHAEKAIAGGAAELPFPVKMGMKFTAKLMTKSVYYL